MTSSIEEAERYAPQPPQMPQPPTRSRIGSDREREPTKRARTGTVFPFKSAIAVGIVLILVGAGILWGKSVVDDRHRPVQVVSRWRRRRRTRPTPPSKPKIPDRVGQPSSSDQVAPVAQRVVLYDEDPVAIPRASNMSAR